MQTPNLKGYRFCFIGEFHGGETKYAFLVKTYGATVTVKLDYSVTHAVIGIVDPDVFQMSVKSRVLFGLTKCVKLNEREFNKLLNPN